MPFGLPWTEEFIRELSDEESRNEFVRDQVRVRLALLIRTLREQEDRGWSQAELGKRMGKPQSVVSRIEDPDYGKLSLQTLFEVAEAFGLPLWVDIPEWDEWLRRSKDIQREKLYRQSFDADALIAKTESSRNGVPAVRSMADFQEQRKAAGPRATEDPPAPTSMRSKFRSSPLSTASV